MNSGNRVLLARFVVIFLSQEFVMTALPAERASASVDQQRLAAVRKIGIAALAGATLGAAAIYWLRRAQRAEQDNPPIGRFVKVSGSRLHYAV